MTLSAPGVKELVPISPVRARSSSTTRGESTSRPSEMRASEPAVSVLVVPAATPTLPPVTCVRSSKLALRLAMTANCVIGGTGTVSADCFSVTPSLRCEQPAAPAIASAASAANAAPAGRCRRGGS